MTEFPIPRRAAACLAALLALGTASPFVAAQARTAAATTPSTADYIIAVVNQELVTNAELQSRLAGIRADAARSNAQLPPPGDLRKQVLQALVDERVQVTNARETGPKLDEVEIDRAVNNVAVQNQMTLAQLRQRLQQQGLPYATFRNNLKDQLLVERVREREVNQRIKISDADVDALIEQRRAASGKSLQLNVAQILVTVPENAPADQVAQRRSRAEAALARVRGGEDFATVGRDISEDGNKAQGGEIGMRGADRLPDLFVEGVRALKPGEVAPALVKSGAGFHVLKLLARQDSAPFTIPQSRVRHILLRVSPQLTAEAASRRLAEFKRQITAGTKTFEQLARENSEDGSAAAGGDLGWTSPGAFVPEFEEAMNALQPGGISDPVISRFGVHLIQVIDRREVVLDTKQQREQARNELREQKFEAAYLDWVRDIRSKAYIEYREAPL